MRRGRSPRNWKTEGFLGTRESPRLWNWYLDKHSLLRLIANIYGHDIEITKDPSFLIDRSLDSSKFLNKTGYKAPDWPELIKKMFADWSARKNEI